jgi:hypothetical protein
MDFQMPRTPGGFRSSGTDYSMSQMSAPIAPPSDFSQAFQASMATGSSNSARTPMRESFSGGPLGITQGSGSGDRPDEFGQDSMGGMQRKRSFTGSASATAAGQSAYSSTT